MGPGHGREEEGLCTPEPPALHRKAREEEGLSRGHGVGVQGPSSAGHLPAWQPSRVQGAGQVGRQGPLLPGRPCPAPGPGEALAGVGVGPTRKHLHPSLQRASHFVVLSGFKD